MPFLLGIEGRLTDWMFKHGRPDPSLASTDIVLLLIDDKSLDSVGRWPWPRQRLADAIRTIDSFGARVIALDVIFPDPQKPEWLADGSRIDHDEEFKRAIREAKARVLLAVEGEAAKKETVWPELDALLRKDITIGAPAIIHTLALTGDRVREIRGHLRRFKGLVLRDIASTQNLDAAGLRALVVPNLQGLGDFPERRLIDVAVDAARATRAIRERLADADGRFATLAEMQPPLAALAEVVDNVGIVFPEQDVDGQLRRLALRWDHDGKVYVQLGLAAASAYLGKEALPGQKRLLLSWPRISPPQPVHRTISLGVVISLANVERRLAQAATERDAAKAELAGLLEVTEDIHDEIVSEAELWGVTKDDELESLEVADPEEREARRKSNLARTYLKRTDELERGTRELTRARVRLRPALAGKLVLIGSSATGNFGDFFPTAIGTRTPGVVAHGLVANAALTGYVVQEASPTLGAALALALGILAAFVTTRLGPRLALLVVVATGTIYFAVNTLFVFSRQHVSLAMATPLFALFFSWLGTQVLLAVLDRREKWQLRRQFGARISKRLFDHLIEHPDQVHMEGEEREVTCLFSDLAGFTEISEQLDSRETVALLNRYMWAMNDELSKVGAYVNKFLGDGIMAVWGAFGSDTAHAENACLGALACMRRLTQLNQEPEFADLPDLKMRIGIATGVVTVGDCGAPPDLRDYTVIGDSVNLAARLESASKQFGTSLLVNGDCRDQLRDDIVFTRPLGKITVVGQKTPSDVYELLALHGEETPAQRTATGLTLQAVTHFRERDFAAAREAWSALERTAGLSPLARLYVEAIEYAEANPEEPFDGVLHLGRK